MERQGPPSSFFPPPRIDSDPTKALSPAGAPTASFSPSQLTIDQLRELREVWLAVAETSDPAAAGSVLTARIANVIKAPVGLLARDSQSGEIAVESAAGDLLAASTIAALQTDLRNLRDDLRASVVTPESGGAAWTVVQLGARANRTRLLLLPGDWSRWPSVDWLERFARDLSAALRVPAGRGRRRRRTQLLTNARLFSRRLAEMTREEDLNQLVVDTFAQATTADQAALALIDEEDGHLSIAATHGYPIVLVEHVRIAPGHGVIGRVFSSQQSMLVTDVSRLSPLHPQRPRYRTPSFLAVPLLLGQDAVGVLTLTDRADSRPFDRGDLVAARTLAAPAALAVGRQQLSRRSEALAHAIAVEPLTGLFNRRHFSVRLEEEVERARRYAIDLALLLVDIDNFKMLNDTRGHLVGDLVLRDTANILRQSVRVFDVCTRYGGDEFAILMPGSTAQSAMQSADRIRQRVEAYRPSGVTLTHDDRITISVGVSARKPAASAEEMIASADRALYAAKAEGKNRVRLVE
jgi:diguanylate cyclase (GGDEF)-like protein